ncbi:leucyl aminopeptidase [Neisseriaceae bacterium CLB008]
MKFSINTQATHPNQDDTLVLWVSAEQKASAALNILSTDHQSLINALIKQKNIGVEKAVVESLFVNHQDALGQVVLAGLGAQQDRAGFEKTYASVAKKIVAAQIARASVDLTGLSAEAAATAVSAIALAFGDAAYQCLDYQQGGKVHALTEVVFLSEHAETLQAALATANVLVKAMNLAKDLGNAPGNVCTPAYLANQAKLHAEAAGAQAKILDKDDILALKMGSFWSVAKGSTEAPYFIELSYNGGAKEDAPVVLVGKGITFDSGGISLKPGPGMEEMRYDMGGAASVIAAFCAAAELKLPLNLVALVPTCENMPAGNANKPGDIVTSMKGLTIEVQNTDAEGRLILCDALTYAERFNPKAVVDVATLTGAVIIALGHVGSGIMGNNQDLVNQLLTASTTVNDKAWQLPLWDEFQDQLKSGFADLRNIGGRPAGTITAACFLSRFAEDYPWAHIDMAGTGWNGGSEAASTGRPVPLLLTYLQQVAHG